DFRAEGGEFRVHTRWIETDFAEPLAQAVAPHARVAPAPPAPLLRLAIEIDGKRHELGLPADLLAALPPGVPAAQAAPKTDRAVLTAPVPGTLTLWQAENGAKVEQGQIVATIEAMKMETRIEAHRAGRLT